MRTLSVACLALGLLTAGLSALPCTALAGSFKPTELGGCSIPLLPGAKLASEQSNTFENGNLVYNTSGAQHMVFWFPGASGPLTPQTVTVYAEAFASSGAWIGVAESTWETVEGSAAARMPVKMSKDQPVQGRMLMWASETTGRYFMYVLTPSWSGAGKASMEPAALDALVTEAGAAVSCAGAGKVVQPLAVLDPKPANYNVDTADLPRLAYVRTLGGHVAVLWRATVAGEGTCVTPAEALFANFVGADPKLKFTGPSDVVADNLDGEEEGPRCDVQRPITGMSAAAEGDFVRYLAFACPDGSKSLVLAMELVGGSAAPLRADLGAAVCATEIPGTALTGPAKEPEGPAQERRQWVPGAK